VGRELPGGYELDDDPGRLDVEAMDAVIAGSRRVVSDGVTFAYLADVYVLSEHRGRGLGLELVREAVDTHPWRGMKWYLGTTDAHGLYRKFGFDKPGERALERAPQRD
jgi:GNAT superfamily N-acetyltransferase